MKFIKRALQLITCLTALALIHPSDADAIEVDQGVTPESYCTILGQHCWYIILTEGDAPNRIAYLADLKDRGWRVNDGIEDPKSTIRKARVIQVFENMSGDNPSYNVHFLENECIKTKVRLVESEHYWPDNRISRDKGNNSWSDPSALWMGRAAIFSCVRVIQGHLKEAGLIHALDIYRPADVATIIRSAFWTDSNSALNKSTEQPSGDTQPDNPGH